ncbi:helix-turn-helix transcriptional regulator [Arthrobacter echini]|uniref:Helix-turn-helix transcriptional regulator n=1 Tax=Arthrobacter echini TaxID=1529066 RepID=A0A4S5E026_9MICC|nr:helix-turn-helix transcriptional regulator [Arthrobacter echini]THJ64592.1 helix-turn-helix transcriptional regulator [Arthrobacter echini]
MTSSETRGFTPKATGKTVAANVKRLRMEHNLNIPELGRKLEKNGHPLTATSITRLEAGRRRIDVDDLMALAVALGVSPVTLLLPPTNASTDHVDVTGIGPGPAGVLWQWALADEEIRAYEDSDAFLRASLPAWLLHQRQLAAMQREVEREKTEQIQLLLLQRLSGETDRILSEELRGGTDGND